MAREISLLINFLKAFPVIGFKTSIKFCTKSCCTAEMEYCVSAASMLAEEIWQIAEGFVEVPVYL